MQRLFWLTLVALVLLSAVDATKKKHGKRSVKKEVPRQVKRLQPEGLTETHHKKSSLSHIRSASAGDGVYCKDSLGNTLQWSPGRPDLFKLVVGPIGGRKSADFQTVTAACAHGSFFNIRTCSCELVSEDPIDKDQCLIYLPFNENLGDYSINRFLTIVQGHSVTIDHKNTVTGSQGSAHFDKKSYIELPGRTKNTARMQFSASWCTFFRCENNDGKFDCHENGGLISNRPDRRHISSHDIDSTFSLGVQQPNKLVAKLVYGEQPTDVVVLEHTFQTSGFVHVCVTHDTMNDKLYINKSLVDQKKSLGKMLPVSGPYTIGYTPSQEKFKGLIDEVLICDHAMQTDQITAHYEGNKLFFSSRGYVPQ
jgi:hypothetical protein